jgi:hypothetical protein
MAIVIDHQVPQQLIEPRNELLFVAQRVFLRDKPEKRRLQQIFGVSTAPHSMFEKPEELHFALHEEIHTPRQRLIRRHAGFCPDKTRNATAFGQPGPLPAA